MPIYRNAAFAFRGASENRNNKFLRCAWRKFNNYSAESYMDSRGVLGFWGCGGADGDA